MMQMTMDFSSETILCKRHYERYEEEIRMDLKMLTIMSEEPDAHMYSRNTGPCIGMPLRRYQQRVPEVQKDEANISDRWGVKKASRGNCC